MAVVCDPKHGAFTQPVTPTDLARGQIRLPGEAKAFFPSGRAELEVILRGVRMRARYDPRRGPDRERSAVLRVESDALVRLVRQHERLRIHPGADGLVRLD